MEKLFLNADEVAQMCDCSKQKAYLIIRKANESLREQGYLTQNGKLPRKYFLKRFTAKKRKGVVAK